MFQGDSLTPLLFVIEMMLLNFILRKYIGWYKFTKIQEKVNHLMYMDDVKNFTKTKKELKTLIIAVRIYSQYIK